MDIFFHSLKINEYFLCLSVFTSQLPTKFMEKLKFIDLFCGIGGFHIGMEEASKENNLKAECVFASDIDESCQDKIDLHSCAYDL